MNYRTTIVLYATDLQPGDTLREICPRCDGGSSNEKSLSISRLEDGNLVWQCFRAHCDEKAGAGGQATHVIRKVEQVKPRPVFEGTTQALTEEHLEWITAKWGISEPPYWWYTPDYGGRIAMSIRSPKYGHRGWVLRSPHSWAKTKALMYVEEKEETLSWYKTNPNAPTVLVEDIPSAVRASTYMNAVALLGTAIGISKALEVAENAPRPIIIALDQDATDKAFVYGKRYGLMWDNPEILLLKKDIKDMEEEELCQTIQKTT
jgi:hypothetical protein